MDVVAVISAELDVLVHLRTLELPLEFSSGDIEDFKSAGGTVSSDMDLATGLVNAVPPVGADGASVVVIPVA